MLRNSVRFDLSNWLIHFFRKVDLDSPNAPIIPEHMGWGNIYEDTKISALFMLRCALRQGRLWATWSYRNEVRTIYVPSPAVCFTEMPIAAFLESGRIREQRGEAMSPYALVFPKKKLFELGSNPVIYGLDNRDISMQSGNSGGPRIIDPRALPEREQYRYVTYNITPDRPIDWSHEREWRWPYRGNYEIYEEGLEGYVDDSSNIPGLDFYKHNIHNIGVVVKSKDEASWIAHDILSLIDRKIINKDCFSFILISDDLPPEDELRDPQGILDAINNSIIDLSDYFSLNTHKIKQKCEYISAVLKNIEDKSGDEEIGEWGGCWLWILDNTNELTRGLVAGERIEVSESGRYLINSYEFSDSRSLRQREAMVKKAAKILKKQCNIECGYFSVLGSDNYNGVPFYNDNHLDNRMFYNVSW